ncbi:hypothetical protein DM02DRAFT_124934 [Periconia macrospinosa]|uniref:DUF7907 domain-containing protein n=1 Tax=Periconia macrospinosa TaxID=97972 RepID=A0A2V1DGJ1_9PLEO|nr:hypothetical protein DM02DRAFT_124934 [Periconia macrospinosa]
MKVTNPTIIAFALAVLASAQFDQQSAPFHLVLFSDDDHINGTTLTACHSGAAISSLCLSSGGSPSSPDPLAPSIFRFNTSTQTQPASPESTPGLLTNEIPTAPGNLPIPTVLDFYQDPTVDYALPLFYPGEIGRTIAVTESNFFNVQGYVDYSVNPPKSGEWKSYNRWYACTTYYQGYQYLNVVFKLGAGKPQEPGCTSVEVKRVFI